MPPAQFSCRVCATTAGDTGGSAAPIAASTFPTRNTLFRHLSEAHAAQERCTDCAATTKASSPDDHSPTATAAGPVPPSQMRRYNLLLVSLTSTASDSADTAAAAAAAAASRLSPHFAPARVPCGGCGQRGAAVSALALDQAAMHACARGNVGSDTTDGDFVSACVVAWDVSALRWALRVARLSGAPPAARAGTPRQPNGGRGAEPCGAIALCVFKMSDCTLDDEHLSALAACIRLLLARGGALVDVRGALALAQARYGEDVGDGCDSDCVGWEVFADLRRAVDAMDGGRGGDGK